MDICQCFIFLIFIFTSAGVVAYFLKYFNFEYLLPVLLFTSAGVVACFLLALSSEHTHPVKCYVRHRQILQCGKCDKKIEKLIKKEHAHTEKCSLCLSLAISAGNLPVKSSPLCMFLIFDQQDGESRKIKNMTAFAT